MTHDDYLKANLPTKIKIMEKALKTFFGDSVVSNIVFNELNSKVCKVYFSLNSHETQMIYNTEKNELSLDVNKTNMSAIYKLDKLKDFISKLKNIVNDYNLNLHLTDNELDLKDLNVSRLLIHHFLDVHTVSGGLFNKTMEISFNFLFKFDTSINYKIPFTIRDEELSTSYQIQGFRTYNGQKVFSFKNKHNHSTNYYKLLEILIYDIYLKNVYPEKTRSKNKMNLIKLLRY